MPAANLRLWTLFASLAALCACGGASPAPPIFSEKVWHRVAQRFPSLAFGYVMFDLIPDRVPYYRFSVEGKEISPKEIDNNAAFGYENARFQINALLDPEYVRDVCAHSHFNFAASRLVRNLSLGTESTIQILRCKERVLDAGVPSRRDK